MAISFPCMERDLSHFLHKEQSTLTNSMAGDQLPLDNVDQSLDQGDQLLDSLQRFCIDPQATSSPLSQRAHHQQTQSQQQTNNSSPQVIQFPTNLNQPSTYWLKTGDADCQDGGNQSVNLMAPVLKQSGQDQWLVKEDQRTKDSGYASPRAISNSIWLACGNSNASALTCLTTASNQRDSGAIQWPSILFQKGHQIWLQANQLVNNQDLQDQSSLSWLHHNQDLEDQSSLSWLHHNQDMDQSKNQDRFGLDRGHQDDDQQWLSSGCQDLSHELAKRGRFETGATIQWPAILSQKDVWLLKKDDLEHEDDEPEEIRDVLEMEGWLDSQRRSKDPRSHDTMVTSADSLDSWLSSGNQAQADIDTNTKIWLLNHEVDTSVDANVRAATPTDIAVNEWLDGNSALDDESSIAVIEEDEDMMMDMVVVEDSLELNQDRNQAQNQEEEFGFWLL